MPAPSPAMTPNASHPAEPEAGEAANDPILRQLIEARTDDEADAAIESLIGRAAVLVRSILKREMRPTEKGLDDEEELFGVVQLRLADRFARLRRDPGHAIRAFDDYVATLTYNAVYDSMRRRHPERTRLKNRVRYLLTHDPRLGLWSSPAGLTAGLRLWMDRAPRMDAPALDRGGATPAMLDRRDPMRALEQIFRRLDGPILLDSLVRLLMELWDVVEISLARDAVSDLPSRTDETSGYEMKESLVRTWREIGQLGSAHRAALLLNLRDADGGNALALLLLLGIATFEELATMVGFPPQTLADCWDDLPLDDLTIASMLGLTRQQVINRRQAARARLARRLEESR